MLNLATSTVSRALSDHPDISDATKARVRKVAEEFNYSTNIHARIFRNQHSRLIALVLPEINMFFTPNLIKGINKTIEGSKYSLITFLTNDSYETEKEIVKQCLNWAVEGVMISLSKEANDLTHLQPLVNANIKCLLLDKVMSNPKHPSVSIDSAEASYKAVSHLIKKGHRQILGVFGSPKLEISQRRIEGFHRAMADHRIGVLDENVICVEKSKDLDLILPPILKHNTGLTSIFTMSDELLAKSLYQVSALGLSVPGDLSIVSISDGDYPYLTFPQTTHVKDSGRKMGRTACRLLLQQITEPVPKGGLAEGDDVSLTVDTKLVELHSVADVTSQD